MGNAKIVIIIISIICMIVVLSTPVGWRALATVFNNHRLERVADDMERENNRKERAEEELRDRPELERIKSEFEAFLTENVDRDKAMAIEEFRQSIEDVRRFYSLTLNYAGQGSASIFTIDEAISRLNRLRNNIEQRTIELRRRRELMTPAELVQERTNLLCEELAKSSLGLQYTLHSTGFNETLDLVVINGYMQFVPEMFNMEQCRQLFEEVGLENQRQPHHDFIVFMLKSDDLDGEKFYGKKSDFDMTKLYALRDTSNYYIHLKSSVTNTVVSIFVEEYICCNRISMWWIDGCEAIIVDLRPHGWSKWGLVAPIAPEDARTMYAQNIPVRIDGPAKNFDRWQYHPERLHPTNHFRTARYITRNEPYDNTVTVSTPAEVFIRNGHNPIDIGHQFENINNFPMAYYAYKAAADQGIEIGTLNCAILLLSDKYAIPGYDQRENYAEAEKLLLPLIQSSDPKIQGPALNALGVSCNKRRNFRMALQYFEQGAAKGNPHAQQNLQSLREFLKNHPELAR
ncbi:MAG: hypothetical protein E7053_02205 [Lentisphaerae bacterium]|nr:hypothetical protein [Lentisphaerota bacterium]